MKKVTSVEEYLEVHERLTDALTLLRELLNSTDLEEAIK